MPSRPLAPPFFLPPKSLLALAFTAAILTAPVFTAPAAATREYEARFIKRHLARLNKNAKNSRSKSLALNYSMRVSRYKSSRSQGGYEIGIIKGYMFRDGNKQNIEKNNSQTNSENDLFFLRAIPWSIFQSQERLTLSCDRSIVIPTNTPSGLTCPSRLRGFQGKRLFLLQRMKGDLRHVSP